MKRVLICDDAIFMRTMLKNILDKNGFIVVGEAGTGFEAINKYQEVRPDIVTMDITMPEMDGVQAVRLIRSIDEKAIIIMVSAMGQNILITECIQAGAKSFIVKPFKAQNIIETLNHVIECHLKKSE